MATSLIIWPAAPFFLMMKGKDITIPQGTEITAFIDGDQHLDMAKFGGAPDAGAPATAAAGGQVTLAVDSNPTGADSRWTATSWAVRRPVCRSRWDRTRSR